MKLFRVFLFLTVFATSACGTLFCGRQQTILVDSDPIGVEILLDGNLLGTTPATIRLKRTNSPVLLMAHKEGYIDQSIMLNSQIGMGAVLDGVFAVLLITGTTGFLTDASNETIWSYAPNQFFIDMVKKGEESLPENKLKMFVSKNFDSLSFDATNGGGQSLDTLVKMTGMTSAALIPVILNCDYPSALIHALNVK